MDAYYIAGISTLALVGLTLFLALCFRTVVPTNAVHIVQSGKKTQSYGKDMAGNTYYSWPAWIPIIGVRVSILPLSVFQVELESYAAYDKGRLPFVLDVLAFFRISDPSKAAERLTSINELEGQLQGIMQGAIRTILANAEIEDILGKRAEFSVAFTKEVSEQLPQWGIETVKNIELMDIRDGTDSRVIQNIMAKQKSKIEMESRVAVADNNRTATEREIEAKRQVDLSQQEADETVGKRQASKDQAVGIANQQSQQAIAGEAAKTATAQMAVAQVTRVRDAQITKEVAETNAQQAASVNKLEAEGIKAKTVTEAEGQRDAMVLAAAGTKAKGEAEGAAEQAKLMAPVNAQIALADEIGTDKGYQEYLQAIRAIEKDQAVGIAQAAALEHADVKIVTTASDAAAGLDLVALGAKAGAFLSSLRATAEKPADK